MRLHDHIDRRISRSKTNIAYLSEEYFRLYKLAIERGLKGNLPLDVLYDEQQFPTGMAGGQFAAKYPISSPKASKRWRKMSPAPPGSNSPLPRQRHLHRRRHDEPQYAGMH